MLHSKRGQACRSSGLSTPVPSHDVCDLVLYIVAETSPGVLSTPLEEQNDKATAHRAGLDYSSRPLHSHVPADSIKKTSCPPCFRNYFHCAFPLPLPTSTTENHNVSIAIPFFPPDLPLRTHRRITAHRPQPPPTFLTRLIRTQKTHFFHASSTPAPRDANRMRSVLNTFFRPQSVVKG